MSNEKKTRGSKKVVAALALLLSVGVIGQSAAYFTDKETKDLTARAGTMNMKVDWTKTDIDGTLDILNPGDKNPLEFKVSSTAEKAMDHKVVMTVSLPSGNNTFSADHEFKILDSKGAELTSEVSTDKKTITYTVQGGVLSGSIEDDASGKLSADYAYQFAMDEGCLNAWQGQSVNVKVEVFAKQAHNIATGDWTLISSFETVAD